MTDNEEIMKALEECIELRFDDTEYATVRLDTLTNALDLINRQKAENKRLEKEVNLVSIQFQDLQERQEESQAKIEEFMKETAVTTLIDDAVVYTPTIEDYNKFKKKFKSEAYTEFVEKLKEFMHNKFKALDDYEFEYITERDIDNTLKEIIKK